MTPTELKEKLVKQYNEAAGQLQSIQGAIAACDALIEAQENPTEETTEELPTDD